MYSNKRREHIHIIRQSYNKTEVYTGTRIIFFFNQSDKGKKIISLDDFKKHDYKSPKLKRHEYSHWKQCESNIKDVFKKEMVNYSSDKKYKMVHYIYESDILKISDYKNEVLKIEEIHI